MKHRVKLSILSAVLAPAFLLQADEHTVEKTINVGGVERSYLLHIPPSLPRDKAVPLVVVFHGGGGTGAIGERFTRFSELSDRERFIVVYPDALNKNWNDGRAGRKIRSQQENVDDIGFVVAMLDAVGKEYTIDPKRVYATGPSNGGFFSNRVGAELSERFAAIAPVIGGMAPAVAESFHPAEPISVLIIQGTDDPLIAYEGGNVRIFGFGAGNRGKNINSIETLTKWVNHNGCDPKPSTTELPDLDPDDETTVVRSMYHGGRNATEVVFYQIVGGGHTWPGGSQYLPERLIGKVSREIDATEVIWEFFKSHPKP